MARLIIWAILAVIIIRLLWKFTRAVLEGAGMLQSGTQPPAVKLVRDPVCGVFVVPTSALTAGSGANTRYFCSEKCRKQWTAQ